MYLRHGGDYNNLEERDERGRTPLLQMLESWVTCPTHEDDYDGDLIILKAQVLLSHGVDIDTRDDYGRGCLHTLLDGSLGFHPTSQMSEETITVFLQGIIKFLAYLIRMGADIHAVDEAGISVTEFAHLFRWGRLWEEALRQCEIDVQKVYARDYWLGGTFSDDIYAPDVGHPRLVHTLDRAYYDKWTIPGAVDVLLLEPLDDLQQAVSRFKDLSDLKRSEHDKKSSDLSNNEEEPQYPDDNIMNGGNEDTPLHAEDVNKDNQRLSGGETDDAAEISDSDDDAGGVPIA